MRLNVQAMLALFCFCLCSGSVSAGIITFTDRLAFDLAAPGLALEDFEVGTAAADVSNVGTSVNSATNAGDITTGELLPGFSLSSVQGGDMVVLGSGTVAGLTSNAIAPNFFAEEMRLDLLPSIFAVGFDILSNNTGTVDALFYNSATLLGTLTIPTSTSGLNFGGAIAFGGDVITRVDFVNENPTGQGVIIDNLAFGNPATASVPTPATLALLILGVVGLGWSRRTSA